MQSVDLGLGTGKEQGRESQQDQYGQIVRKGARVSICGFPLCFSPKAIQALALPQCVRQIHPLLRSECARGLREVSAP